MPFQPSLMVQLHQINILIQNEKDETLACETCKPYLKLCEFHETKRQDLLNQYHELINTQYETEKRVYEFQFGTI
jgi:hypothetical protein